MWMTVPTLIKFMFLVTNSCSNCVSPYSGRGSFSTIFVVGIVVQILLVQRVEIVNLAWILNTYVSPYYVIMLW